MAPARICGVSMLPPKRSGTSELRTSPPGGATPTVPSIGSIGSSTRRSTEVATKPTVFRAPVDLVDPGGVGQRVLERGDPVGAGQPAEERDRRRGGPVARGLQGDQVQREGVPRLGALDVEGAGLRVHEAQVDLLARQVLVDRSAPQKASSDHSRSAVPGRIRASGARAAEGERVLLERGHDLDDVHGAP